MSAYPSAFPLDSQRTFDVYLPQQRAGQTWELVGTLVGYRAVLSTLARLNLGGGGNLVQASETVAFSLDENGGPIPIEPEYVLVELEINLPYVVTGISEPPGWLVATCTRQAPTGWKPPSVIP